MKKELIFISVSLLLLQACGSIVHGSRQDLSVQTVPGGVTARIGSQECVTPCILNDIPRNSKEIYLRKGNGKEKFYYLDNQREINVGSSIVGNICCLEIGLLVDFLSGSAYTIRTLNIRFDDLPD